MRKGEWVDGLVRGLSRQMLCKRGGRWWAPRSCRVGRDHPTHSHHNNSFGNHRRDSMLNLQQMLPSIRKEVSVSWWRWCAVKAGQPASTAIANPGGRRSNGEVVCLAQSWPGQEVSLYFVLHGCACLREIGHAHHTSARNMYDSCVKSGERVGRGTQGVVCKSWPWRASSTLVSRLPSDRVTGGLGCPETNREMCVPGLCA
jgi:hypothetical protein